MTHFGYTIERGVKPAFFIDDKTDLQRIMSTLRDPNSLGAFLILPMCILWSMLLEKREKAKRLLVTGLFGLHGLALFLTFSRGAWVGVLISLSVLTVVTQRKLLKTWLVRFWPLLIGAVLVFGAGAYSLRDQYAVQNIIFHSDETTTAEYDSNEYHLFFAQKGLKGIVQQPLGHGPGTAGVVSIHKDGKGLLTENYFIQIGYEAGVLAILLLGLAHVMVAWRLAGQLHEQLAASLFAALWGLILIGLVSHVWTNEAVAASWWLPAGVMIATDKTKRHN
jgi:hypothetical protein